MMAFLSDLFFQGCAQPRLQLWFNNPNKAATLLGCLCLVFLTQAFRARKRVLTLVWGLLSFASGVGLFLTYSRGGWIAFVGGLVIMLFEFRHRFAALLPRIILVGSVSLMALVFYLRGDGSSQIDGSIQNRFEIWRVAPCMMADARQGWGVGQAGDAYMGWYQPLSNHERYRTLVNSHLTWLVEFGYWGRILYLVGWFLVLGICFLRCKRRGDPQSLSVWVCICGAACFSSVLESLELWVLPVVVLFPAIGTLIQEGRFRRVGMYVIAAFLFSVLVVFGLHEYGERLSRGNVRIRVSNGAVCFGAHSPTIWIVEDRPVMGTTAYGRALRLYAQQFHDCACGLAPSLLQVPLTARHLVLCGEAANVSMTRLSTFKDLTEIRVLSPCLPMRWLNEASNIPIRVFCGEFDARCPSTDHPRLHIIDGNGAYLTHWPEWALR